MRFSSLLFVLIATTFPGTAKARGEFHQSSSPNWNSSLELRVKRCFSFLKVKISCDIEKVGGEEESGELKISAIDYNGRKFFYGYGKMLESSLCRRHLREIKRLAKGQQQVCIGGDGENDIGTNETFVRWREIETRNGRLLW